jgi:signal transduction histidine kinase
MNISTLIPPERVDERPHLHERLERGEHVEHFETVRIAKGGERLDVSLTVSAVLDASGQVTGVSAIARDITERKRMEREILEISDSERQRIGHDLHDDLCQYLVGVSLLANVLEDTLAKKNLQECEDARQINDLVKQAVVKARNLAKGLSPVDLTGSGFMAAIEELALITQRMFKTSCLFECEKPVIMDDTAVAIHLYRITQEAVHNAAKHSRADRIVIRATVDSGVTLHVEDDGIGCAELETRSNGLGLHIMRYRARMIGATLRFEGMPGGGTIVTCSVPGTKDEVTGRMLFDRDLRAEKRAGVFE